MRVKPSVTTPKYKWGSVSHASVGVVTEISGGSNGGRAGNGDVRVDFPQQNKWVGLLAEMERVPACHAGVTCDGCQAGPPLMGPRFRDDGTQSPQATGRDEINPSDCGRNTEDGTGKLCFPDGILCQNSKS